MRNAGSNLLFVKILVIFNCAVSFVGSYMDGLGIGVGFVLLDHRLERFAFADRSIGCLAGGDNSVRVIDHAVLLIANDFLPALPSTACFGVCRGEFGAGGYRS